MVLHTVSPNCPSQFPPTAPSFDSHDPLQAAIKYDEDDLPGAKSMVEQCASDDPDTENNLGLFG